MSLHLRNLKKNVWFAVAEFVLNIVLVFGSYRLLIWYGGIDTVGLWSTLFAWTSLIRIADVGMSNSTMRFIALQDRETNSDSIADYIETGLITNLVLFIALAVAGYFLLSHNLAHIVDSAHFATAQAILPIMLLGFVLSNIAGVVLGSLSGLHLGYIRSQITVAANLVQLLAVIVVVPRHGIAGLAWSQVLQFTFSCTVGWFVVRRNLGLRHWAPYIFSRRAFREMLGFSLTSQVANTANGLFDPLSKLLVSHFFGLNVLGMYELAFKTVSLSRNAIIAGVSATVPAMTAQYNKGIEEIVPTYNSAQRLTMRAIVAVMALIVIASPLVAYVWLGYVSLEFVRNTAILSIGAIFNAAGAGAYNLGIITGRMKNNILVTFSNLVVLMALGVIAGSFFSSWAIVAVNSFCWGLAGVWIKAINEPWLPRKYERSARWIPWWTFS
jgi:O-antigen/teichoic acid export membrane protein